MPTIAYKCPNCGGEITYAPGKGSFTCPYCESHFTEEEISTATPLQSADRREFAPPPENRQTTPANAVFYSCPSCGAEIVTDETTAASFCYYCHSPVILSGRLSGEWAPNMIVPFAIDKETANKTFLAWCRKRRFLPRAFFNSSQLEKLSGVYFPTRVVDTKVATDFTANATNVRSWQAGNTRYTETRNYRLERTGEAELQDLTYAALNRDDARLTQGIYPYDIEKAIPFNMTYLSGFLAERRNLNREDIDPSFEQDVQKLTRALLQNTIGGYGSVQPLNYSAIPLEADWQYTLLPAWVLTYRYKEKTYYFALNGQTGQVFGTLPISGGRLFGLFCGVSGVLFALLTAWGYFAW